MKAKLEELNVLNNGMEYLDFESIETYLSIIENAKIKTVIEGKTQIAQIDIIDTSASYEPLDVANTIGANMIQLLKGDRELHHKISIPQRSYRLYFMLDKPVSLKKVNEIEESLVSGIKQIFKLIDVNAGDEKEDLIPTLDENRDIRVELSYQVVNNDNYITVSEFRTIKKDIRDLEDISREAQSMINENVYTDNELLIMSEFISTKDTLVINDNDYTRIAIGLWNSQQLGRLKESTVLGILDNLNKGTDEYDEEYYRSFKVDNSSDYEGRRATVGSFIQYASNNGYNRDFYERFYVEKESMAHMNTIEIMIEQYIDEKDMYDLIVNPYKAILVDSPTGSGKSHSSIMAGRRWLEEDPENRHLYFPVPNVILAEQSTDGGEHGKALVGTRTPKEIKEYNKKMTGLNFAIGTYDKAEWHINEIIENNPNAEIVIIADEAHKEVFDYFYRSKAIKGLFGLRGKHKFIGLSGTPQEINKEYYDQLVKFTIKDAKPIFNNFKVPIYHKMKDYDLVVAGSIMREVKAGRKVLAYVNNIEKIGDIEKVFKSKDIDIKSIGVHANVRKDTPEGKARDYLVEEEKFPENYDVVIATTSMSDGVNILNDNENYSVIISPDRQVSPLFNLSVIKQMSNRFRNRYDNIIIPVFITEGADKKRLNHVAPYGIESRYKTLLLQSKAISEYLKKEFGDRFNEYHPSLLEVAQGFPHVNNHHEDKPLRLNMNTEEALTRYRALQVNTNLGIGPDDELIIDWVETTIKNLFTPDERKLRKIASKDAEAYYSYFPNAFIKELGKILKIEPKEYQADDFIFGDDDKSKKIIQNLLLLNEDIKKLEDEEKEEYREEILTESIYAYLVEFYYRNNFRLPTQSEVWINLVESMSRLDISILKHNIELVDYKGMLKLMERINNGSGVKGLRRRLRAIKTIKSFNEATSVSVTNTIFTELADFFNNDENFQHESSKGVKFISNRMINEKIDEIAAKYKSLDVDEGKVKQVMNQYFLFDNISTRLVRGKGNIEVVSLTVVGNIYGMSKNEIGKVYEYNSGNIDIAI